MNIRSQGVPIRSRFIREDADRFHPRSDGADFRLDVYTDNQGVPIYRAELDAERQSDDFPIDDEPESVVCTTIGTCNGWRKAHESAVEVGKLQAEVQRLERELEYAERRLANMTEARDDWKAFAQKLAKEVS